MSLSVEQDENNDQDTVYALEMDISDNMGKLKSLASRALSKDLSNYSLWILAEKELSDDQTLKDHCGSHVGLIQVHFSLDHPEKKVNVVDVLKSADVVGIDSETSKTFERSNNKRTKSATVSRWITSIKFRDTMKKLNMQPDPSKWKMLDVWHWLTWAEQQFGLKHLDKRQWRLGGRALMAITQSQFRKLVPYDPGDVFFMHFELLKRTGVVAVMCDPNSETPSPVPPKGFANFRDDKAALNVPEEKEASGGPHIQLWQYLLDLLLNPNMVSIISWCGTEGEFKLHQPETVAHMWGIRKGKAKMSYEKLSRSLRYYYDWDMMRKVSGKKFVYKFTLDLKSVLGYSSKELQEQVEACLPSS